MNERITSRQHAAPTATGIAGLDHILRGGFPAYRLYLVEGTPGLNDTPANNRLLKGA